MSRVSAVFVAIVVYSREEEEEKNAYQIHYQNLMDVNKNKA